MNAPSNVTVPDIGDFKDIPVIKILVKPGDQVAKDPPLVVLESDKATLNIPAPICGTIKTLQVAIGDRVSAGSVLLARLESSAEAAVEAPAASAVAVLQSSLPGRPVATPIASGHGAAAVTTPAAAVSPPGSAPASPSATQGAVHASPSIRRIARAFGTESSRVPGSGQPGRIVRADLLRFVKSTLVVSPASSSSSSAGGIKLVPWPQIDFAKFSATKHAPISEIRRLSAPNLARNAIIIPHVTNFEDPDITDPNRSAGH